ncbi:YraN family protein [Roseateles sp. BYS180W]|uniref:UPF0102 protein ACG0Z6_12200 n=1 Tax=Roseateles rivi TaxID=3299028 RepID=A0ABW7FXF3_9BURK
MFKFDSTKQQGDRAEDRALSYLQRQGLQLVARNYRVARGPARHAGEVDLIMRDADGTVVFVEVRARSSRNHGGAAASVSHQKRRRILYAARHYLLRQPSPPPCRFDVLALEGDDLQWLPAAFDASGG